MSFKEKEIIYFNQEGRGNKEKVIDIVVNNVNERPDINRVIVFSADGKAALHLKEKLPHAKIVAVTFPYKKQFTIETKEGEQIITPPTSKTEVKKDLADKDVVLLQGGLPFEDIIIPNSPDTKIQTINYTLSIFGGGMRLCVEAIIVATDCGEIEQGEKVIAMSADTAIVATGCRKEWLFHPIEGLEVKEILCKPSNLSITKAKKYQ